MIYIIGNNLKSILLRNAALKAGLDADICESVNDIQEECDLIILNTEEDLESRQAEVAVLAEKTSAPIAATISLNYACAMAKNATDKSRIVAIRTMEDEYIGEYIELTKTFDTDESVYAKVLEILKSFNGRVAEVPDIIGGIFYRIMFLNSNMSAYLVSEGVTVTDVDNSMRYGANIKRPSLQIADEIGLDRVLEILTVLYHETGRPAYRPCPLLKQMVNAGRLGKKTGQGFYTYD
ncbi:MAG: hypothetical protein IKU81_03755 [Oscillibacter sp.]|nr:hypothetical protein [Oscillibacter sp.]